MSAWSDEVYMVVYQRAAQSTIMLWYDHSLHTYLPIMLFHVLWNWKGWLMLINHVTLKGMLRSSVVSNSLRPHGLYSPPGSSVHRIFQARILEWVAISYSRGLPEPGIEPVSPVSPALQVDSLPLCHLGSQAMKCTYGLNLIFRFV